VATVVPRGLLCAGHGGPDLSASTRRKGAAAKLPTLVHIEADLPCFAITSWLGYHVPINGNVHFCTEQLPGGVYKRRDSTSLQPVFEGEATRG
jgi:hypothetical protein